MPQIPRVVKPKPTFDVTGFLCTATTGTSISTYQPNETICSQGDAADSVFYLQEGIVKLSVLSETGREGVVAMLETGAFFGERALAGDPLRREVATAITLSAVMTIPTPLMIRLLHDQDAFSERFIGYLLTRGIRTEEDVIDQLFNSADKRLARVLLLLAHYGGAGETRRLLPPISQQTLAEMVGTTRSRVNFFMNKFKRLGYIEYDDGLKVNDSLVTVITRDELPEARRPKAG